MASGIGGVPAEMTVKKDARGHLPDKRPVRDIARNCGKVRSISAASSDESRSEFTIRRVACRPCGSVRTAIDLWVNIPTLGLVSSGERQRSYEMRKRNRASTPGDAGPIDQSTRPEG